jgi:hypothetical protein
MYTVDVILVTRVIRDFVSRAIFDGKNVTASTAEVFMAIAGYGGILCCYTK